MTNASQVRLQNAVDGKKVPESISSLYKIIYILLPPSVLLARFLSAPKIKQT